MKARFARRAEVLFRYRRASAFGFLLVLLASNSATAQQGTPEQRKACTPDVYRLCAGEIPNVRAITACLRRQKASLSPSCAAVFPQ
ncbi:hypothetical protein [Bradyrhizobium roseum]|uniref:hypothetical protein n=1 Tax=Bradyrhizobium roseum TaxID=3056648 RepID=UPI002614AD72|nr:hypothetical protein [Bradyrhizobium roseus]WKA25590.1 hypothetical protein QUH67_18315 [Bradyrhizobium roseus]